MMTVLMIIVGLTFLLGFLREFGLTKKSGWFTLLGITSFGGRMVSNARRRSNLETRFQRETAEFDRIEAEYRRLHETGAITPEAFAGGLSAVTAARHSSIRAIAHADPELSRVLLAGGGKSGSAPQHT